MKNNPQDNLNKREHKESQSLNNNYKIDTKQQEKAQHLKIDQVSSSLAGNHAQHNAFESTDNEAGEDEGDSNETSEEDELLQPTSIYEYENEQNSLTENNSTLSNNPKFQLNKSSLIETQISSLINGFNKNNSFIKKDDHTNNQIISDSNHPSWVTQEVQNTNNLNVKKKRGRKPKIISPNETKHNLNKKNSKIEPPMAIKPNPVINSDLTKCDARIKDKSSSRSRSSSSSCSSSSSSSSNSSCSSRSGSSSSSSSISSTDDEPNTYLNRKKSTESSDSDTITQTSPKSDMAKKSVKKRKTTIKKSISECSFVNDISILNEMESEQKGSHATLLYKLIFKSINIIC